MNKIVFLAGLPRSGSTLLTNILGMHNDIKSTPSSPLCNIIQSMRRTWSQDSFFKAQLDNNFNELSNKTKRITLSAIQAWSYCQDKNIVIDKSRSWLFCIEWLREIMPDFKMILTIRDLRDIYTSIEKRHRDTLLIDFPDNMEHNIVDDRANALFSDNGIIGSIIKGFYNIGDVPNITKNLYIWRYEDFLENPEETIKNTFNFIGVDPIEIDFNKITQNTFESDSHYNMKFLHTIKSKIEVPPTHNELLISPRILNTLVTKFQWFYDSYYPKTSTSKLEVINNDNSDNSSKLIKELEVLIQEETET